MSSQDLRDFEDHPVWRDMKSFITQQCEADRQNLIRELDERMVRMIQGRLQAAEFMLGYTKRRQIEMEEKEKKSGS